jgi:mannose-6-phosphate isomerase-like protein (cupin superfamily)
LSLNLQYSEKGRPVRTRMQKGLALRQCAESLTELWSPRVVGAIDDLYVKVAKLHGTFCWHNHPHEDELFLILKGSLRIELDEARPVVLNEGEMFVVLKGVRHYPVAEEECLVMLIERKSTLHSGDVVNERTRSLAEQLRPFRTPA